jgi:hypothetical protein
MTRKLIIFGNGIGMALSPENFGLASVMPKVWNGTTADGQPLLSHSQKQLIAGCIEGVEKETGPSNENQLMGAQVAQFGHELITEAVEAEKQNQWFTNDALSYPQAISKYVYEVARQLDLNSQVFGNDERLKEFLNSFIPFLQETNSHVATLNYDTLLYSAFNDGYTLPDGTYIQICQGQDWKTHLCDGYRPKTGFQKENFERPTDGNFGFYLHLHGSPLIVDGKTRAKKLCRNQIAGHIPQSAHHIILSDGKMKPLLIQRSEVLSLYWHMLESTTEEIDEIIVFGYGGGDDHLNTFLRKSRKPIRIVEYADPEISDTNSEALWEKRIGAKSVVIEGETSFALERMDNILSFSDWVDPFRLNPF